MSEFHNAEISYKCQCSTELSVGERTDEGIREVAEQHGKHHPEFLFSLLTVAAACVRNEDYEDAIRYYREALPLNRKLNGDLHSKVGDNLVAMALAMDALGLYTEEMIMLEESLTIFSDPSCTLPSEGTQHGRKIVHVLNQMGNCYFHRGMFNEASKKYKDAVTFIEIDDKSSFRSRKQDITLFEVPSMSSISDKCLRRIERSKKIVTSFVGFSCVNPQVTQ